MGVNPKCIDDYTVLEWKNLTKLHIFAAKYKVNIYSEKTISLRWLCIDLEFTPSEIMAHVKPKNRPYFPVSFKYLIDVCCGNSWKVNTANVSRQEITTGKIPSHIDIDLPYNAARDTEVQRMNFVDIVDNPSVVYITKRESVTVLALFREDLFGRSGWHGRYCFLHCYYPCYLVFYCGFW